jgi:hypothetical protein
MFDASRHITKRVPTLVCFAGNVPTDFLSVPDNGRQLFIIYCE